MAIQIRRSIFHLVVGSVVIVPLLSLTPSVARTGFMTSHWTRPGADANAGKEDGAPTGLSAIAITVHEVDLSWQAPLASTVTSHYRINRNGVLLATVPAADLVYVDTTVQPGNFYAYTVVASTTQG